MATRTAIKFAYGFSVALGIVMFSFGVLNILGVPADPNACAKHCGLLKTLHQLLGQAGYNVFAGLLWLTIGALFVLLPFIRSRRRAS